MERFYRLNSKLILVLILILGTIFMIIQSYYAQPRDFYQVIKDTFVLWLFVISLIFIVQFTYPTLYFIIGLGYLMLSLDTAYIHITNFVKPFATIFFTTGLWLVLDFINYKIYKRNVIKDLLTSLRFAIAVAFVSIFLASIIEFINASARLWWYYEPFPSLKILGVTPLTFVVGWLPWILALISGIYLILGVKKK